MNKVIRNTAFTAFMLVATFYGITWNRTYNSHISPVAKNNGLALPALAQNQIVKQTTYVYPLLP